MTHLSLVYELQKRLQFWSLDVLEHHDGVGAGAALEQALGEGGG